MEYSNDKSDIALCLGGDAEAFGRIAERYRGKMFSVAYGMLRNAQDAEDSVQEGLTKAYLSLKKFDISKPLHPWLMSIVAHLAIDRIRKQQRFLKAITNFFREKPPKNPQTPDGAYAQDELRETIWRALSVLNGRMRAVLWLIDIEGYEVKEVSEMLNIAPSTARVHLFKARSKVRKLLKKNQGVEK